MITCLILLFILQPTEIRRAVPEIEIASQKITLLNRPKLGETVKVVYEVIPKNSKKNVKIVFHSFKGIRLISEDTIYHFNAVKGIPRKFSIDVEYISTPAVLWARVEGAYSRISLTRYLLSSETGEYGTMKEIQFNPPIEYRFNPQLRKFEFTIFNFEEDRWYKNRAIIDTIRNIAPEITDSLALVLYADIPKVTYPQEIANWSDKAAYLLEQGWHKYINDVDRENFLYQLKEENQVKNEEKLRQLLRERQTFERAKFLKWLMSWLIPVMLLLTVLLVLLIIRSRTKSKVVTPKRIDKLLVYAIYIGAISAAVHFAWPYLHVTGYSTRNSTLVWKTKVRRTEQMKRASYEIKRLNLLKEFSRFKLVSEKAFRTRSGFGAAFTYLDKHSSEIGVEYFFTVEVWPTSEGYQIRQPHYPPMKAIEKFEKNKRALSFISKHKVKQARVHIIDSLFAVTVDDTIIKDSGKIPLHLGYDGKSDLVTAYTVLSDFEDDNFPEIKPLTNLCNCWGYRMKHSAYIKGTWRGNINRWHLTTFIEGGGNDTLHLLVSPAHHFKYWWGPAPSVVKLPDSIINQIYSEFSMAGLPPEYAREHIEVVSTRAVRKPDYFAQSEKDRVIADAVFKWITGVDWLDEINNGEGVQFRVFYEYFADSLRLGKSIHKPERPVQKNFYLRPIRKIIPQNEARDKLFEFLPKEEKFYRISVGLNIFEELSDYGDFIYLIGRYKSYTGIKVDLETGAVIEKTNIYH